MPRTARIKDLDAMYHIMVRSISDILLFTCDEDKERYLKLVKKYMNRFLFKVYAYCIMDTHAHFIIDCNGKDISKIMHCINQCYAQYYNAKYNRRGHLFQDRFKSVIIYDNIGLMNVSAYIHKNPKDIFGFKGNEENYKYSSYGIYLGISKDNFDILNTHTILDQFSNDIVNAKICYIKFVNSYKSGVENNYLVFRDEKVDYRSERKILIRNKKPNDVINYVASYINIDPSFIHLKHRKKLLEFKALSVFLMCALCDIKQKDICAIIGNITQSYASSLCEKGMQLILQKNEYGNLVNSFMFNIT